MTAIIVIIWLALLLIFLYMARKLPGRFGWWCIGIMIALVIYLPVTIGISKIVPSCSPQITCPPISQINWEQKYNEVQAGCEQRRTQDLQEWQKRYDAKIAELNNEIILREKVFKKYPRVRKYFK